MSEQQSLNKIVFNELKGIRNMTFNLGEKYVTGIFGPNGCGKSTILHTLLCLYKPKSPRIDFKFSDFFISVDAQNWIGNSFSYEGAYTEEGRTIPFNRRIEKRAKGWMRSYSDRPDRDVYYIGIRTCLPDVEVEKDGSVHVQKETIPPKQLEIQRIASDVMNFNYTAVSSHESKKKKNYLGCTNNGIKYLSLSMGTGEQRLFRILEVVVNAPKYSLIVIDEIDLTLHSKALDKLINHLVRIAENNKIQIVFTSHRQELTKRNDINVRHIVPNPGGDTMCLESTTTECVERLTGKNERPLEIFVEDDVAKALIERIASELKIKNKISCYCVGDASNLFKVIGGLHLSGRLNDNMIAVTDGDVYTSADSRKDMMKKVVSGTEQGKEELRDKLLAQILQFKIPEGKSPDEYIHNILAESAEDSEITKVAKDIRGVYDRHQLINEIITNLGGSREVELSHIVEQLSQEKKAWNNYIGQVKDWLERKKVELNL